MQRSILLGCAVFALAIGVSSIQAEPPLDDEAAKEQRLHKFWRDYYNALRCYYQEAASWDAAAKAAARPEGPPCRH